MTKIEKTKRKAERKARRKAFLEKWKNMTPEEREARRNKIVNVLCTIGNFFASIFSSKK